ncbi:hypothetical protein [Pseudomonas syringae]|uniref:hypothetical protein n=1 Tax=Pseudomonas syringae TaxID=317 RepID=UPI001F28B887|nr:hypothetical protein [Pseudomonas syringae]MCF5736434.1 hypothetical protein [Pseudomonas syringae]MCF5742285.1 hypothetical protein [Pseudomonas syringae]MCF5751561.1 hypothetical protein [Pseudomonas syringae]MCF5758135.1 hypothetical protein [Pseudomonas syringae]
MSKTRAYTSQTGNVQVTAWQVNKQRKDFYNGQPTPYQYFSIGRPGTRLAVKHVSGKNYPYFSYINSGDGSGAVGGESLSHLLFKEALSEIKQLRLNVSLQVGEGKRTQVSCNLQVVEAEQEKEIALVGGGVRYADVYYKFESEHWLWKKWGGELYIEIRNSNAVNARKQIDIRKVAIPVIEVEIPSIFDYKISDEATNDELEFKHKERIKKMLQSEKGFLSGSSLSNPSTKEYLIDLVKHYKGQKVEFCKERDRLNSVLFETRELLAAEASKVENLSGELLDLKKQLLVAVSEKDAAIADLSSNIASQSKQQVSNEARARTARLYMSLAFIMLVVSAALLVVSIMI